MFTRTAEPHHKYEYRITSKRTELVSRTPARGDPDVDTQRYVGEAAAAAKKHQERLFPGSRSREAAE
jgi:hypothetical protein